MTKESDRKCVTPGFPGIRENFDLEEGFVSSAKTKARRLSYVVSGLNIARVFFQNSWYLQWIVSASSSIKFLSHRIGKDEFRFYNSCGAISFFFCDFLLLLFKSCEMYFRKKHTDSINVYKSISPDFLLFYEQHGSSSPGSARVVLDTREYQLDSKVIYPMMAYFALRVIGAVFYFNGESLSEERIFFRGLAIGGLLLNMLSLGISAYAVCLLKGTQVEADDLDVVAKAMTRESQYRHKKCTQETVNVFLSISATVATFFWEKDPGAVGAIFFFMNFLQLGVSYFLNRELSSEKQEIHQLLPI